MLRNNVLRDVVSNNVPKSLTNSKNMFPYCKMQFILDNNSYFNKAADLDISINEELLL